MKRVIGVLLLLCNQLQGGTFIMGGAAKGGGTSAASAVIYGGIWSGGTLLTASQAATENDVAMPIQVAGTFSKMKVKIGANDRGASTVTFRKGTSGWGGGMSDGNQVININSSQTGRIDEATNGGSYHTDHVNAGDVVSFKFVVGSGGTTGESLIEFIILFTPDNPTYTLTKFGGYTSVTFASSGTEYSQTLGGLVQNGARTETDSAYKFRTAGVWDHLCIVVLQNSYVVAGYAKSRIFSGGSWTYGNQVITIPALTTGIMCNGSGVGDTVADGTLAGWVIEPATSGGIGAGVGLQVSAQSSELLTTNNTGMLIVQQGTSGTTLNTNATNYMAPNGESEGNTTAGQYAIDVGTTMTLSNMSIYVSANTISNTSTAGLIKNTSTTLNLTKGIVGNASGAYIDDDTHTDNLVAGDLVEYKVVAGTTGTSLKLQSLAIKATVPAGTASAAPKHKVN